MKIKDVSISYFLKSGFSSQTTDNVKHDKVLPYLSVVQSVVGNYGIQIGNSPQYNTGDGGFFIAPSFQHQCITHHANPKSNTMVCRWVFLDIRINGQHRFEDFYDVPIIVPDSHKKRMHVIFDKMFELDNPFDDKIFGMEIIRILFEIASDTRPKPRCIMTVLDLIEKKYCKKISINTLAQAANLSPSRFHAIFKQHVGLSPIQYLNAYRMTLAEQLLTSTDKTISEIARSVGIEDNIYFNKLFKQVFHMSPTKYRKKDN